MHTCVINEAAEQSDADCSCISLNVKTGSEAEVSAL